MELDTETKDTYTVTVTATDPSGLQTTIKVTIKVTNVDEAPKIAIGGLAVSGPTGVSYAEDRRDVVATYMASGPDADMATWTLEGADMDEFDISSSGVLTFGSPPDYDNPADADSDNVYKVTVKASDGTNEDTLDVTVTVTDVVENVAPEFADTEDGARERWRRTRLQAKTSAFLSRPPTITRDTLVYTLGGTDATSFDIDTGSGQLMTLVALDYETKATYSVTVIASDSGGLTDSIGVTITVTNVYEGFEVSGLAATDYAENGTDPVATYSATDPESATITWSLEGDDAGDFDISSSGVLTFGSPPDYENPADADPDNFYKVTVKASDGTNEDTLDVTVTVTDVYENVAPEFPDSEDGARSVAENTAAGEDIGVPVAATDNNGDILAYALGGADVASFDIDAATGQLMTKAALDYETKSSYTVVVTASDPGNLSATTAVTITVTDVDEGFEVSGLGAVDYAENGTGPVATYSATDPESASITWSLEGDDAGDFDISSSGVLTFGSLPDYENPADADTDNVYEVTVKASDGTNEDTWDITVTVTDVDENVAPADPLLDRYDDNDSGEIERSEVFAAINDYLDGDAGAPTRADVFRLIELYLGD